MKEFTGFKKGVNLGGWLSQCDNNDYSEQRFSTFITAPDFDRIAEWGLDHVRLPFDYNVIMTDGGEFKEEGFKWLDFAVEQCKKRGLNIVLDLHKTVGFIFDDPSYCGFFGDEHLQELFYSLWREMAKRYGKEKHVIFELLNEVTRDDFAPVWNKIVPRAIAEIRKIAPDTPIMYGGVRNNSIYGLTLLEKPADDNVVFDFHCYSPLVFTHQKAYWVPGMPNTFTMAYPESEKLIRDKTIELVGENHVECLDETNMGNIGASFFEKLFNTAKEVSEKFGVPLYCGEYGVIDQADPESTVNWFKDIHAVHEKMYISRAAWTYRQKDFGLVDEHYAPVLDRLIKLL